MHDEEVMRLASRVDGMLLNLLRDCDGELLIMVGVLTARIACLGNVMGYKDEIMKIFEFALNQHNDLSDVNKVLDRYRTK